jgi:bifunctional UDP-N-acetylglucosamine pyrophosphorylase/glucosamine-1-phosphate N-acetyltransferase
VLVADGRKLKAWVHALKNDNAKGEYYLTDVIAFANAENDTCRFTEGPVDELFGIDTRADLAVAEGIIQNRYRAAAMAGGVTLIDPASTFLSHDTTFGTDVEVGPFTVFGPGVTIGSHVSIKGFCHFESATIGDRATVGPYARLRPGTAVETCAHVGNFVEIKNARIEEGAKVNHLTYIGDARVGKAANIGAGTITANYDGFSKSLTDIGAGASIGSNTVLVAPVTVGDGAITGAGTVIRKDVPDNAIAVTDAAQKNREGTAKAYRAQRKAIKDTKRKDS